MKQAQRQGRGRPREVRRAEPGTGLPVDVKLSDLSSTTQAILAAAREAAVAGGVGEVTLRAVAARAHVDLSTVKYHFESKAGLLEGLLDSLYRDDVARFAAAAAQAGGVEARLDAYVEMAERDTTADPTRLRLYFELECHALRDPVLRRRMAAHQRWWVEALLSVIIGSQAATEQLSAPERSAVWSFVAAAVDGMTLHRALDPESYPFHAVLEVLRQFIARMEDTPGDR